jgi:hypothetical protein
MPETTPWGQEGQISMQFSSSIHPYFLPVKVPTPENCPMDPFFKREILPLVSSRLIYDHPVPLIKDKHTGRYCKLASASDDSHNLEPVAANILHCQHAVDNDAHFI